MNIARNAVLASRLPQSVPGTTVDRQCGSSQQAVHFAAQAVKSGTMDVVIAAGLESMTPVLMFSSKAGGEYHAGRLRERYPQNFSQFIGAEMMACKYGLSKEQLDECALESHRRAVAATRSGAFDAEILPVLVRGADGGSTGDACTQSPRPIQGVKLLQEAGVTTAANASQICDGASGVLVVSARALKTLGLKPLARIQHMTVLGQEPVIMLEALFEVNEAFAPVPLAWLKGTGADPRRLNVDGGAIPLGHPLGASGTRLMATLVHALRRQGKRYGLQTMCEAGGMANLTIVERL